MPTKAMDLFQAYSKEQLPTDSGYIVSSFFDTKSKYARYEVVAYAGVKNIYLAGDGLTFQTDGNKLHVLVEPASYAKKHIEPVSRDTSETIPHRFSELNVYIAKNQTKVMVSKDPIVSYSSFTILRPTGVNFALVFYPREDILDTLGLFFTETFNKETDIPKSDAKKAAQLVIDGVKKFGLW